MAESYLLDVINRKTVHESFYVEHQHSTLRFLIADPKDIEVLERYLTFDESISSHVLKKSIEQSLCLMATDCFDVCGLVIGQICTKNGHLDKYVKIDWLHVRKDYRNAGVGSKLMKEMLRLVKKKQVDMACLVTNDKSVMKIAEKFKMSVNHVIPNEKPNTKLMQVNICDISDLLVDDPPTLPKAYQLPDVERPQLGEYYAKALGRPLKYVIGVPEDESLVKDFLLNEYFRQTTIPRSLQCRRSDGVELITRFKSEVLQQGLVFMAHDNGRLCGIAVNKLVKIDRSRPRLDESVPEDFSDEIDKQNFRHLGVRTIRAVCGWMDSLTGQMISEDSEKYYVLDMLSVQPSYRGCKIGWKLWQESLKHSQKIGYRYTQTICTAIASNRLATQFGMKKMIEFPYDKLIYRGKKFFETGEAYDGGKVICMYIGDSEKLSYE